MGITDENINNDTLGKVTISANTNTTAQAGEDLVKGDSIYISGINTNGYPIVMKYTSDLAAKGIKSVGITDENIDNGTLGKVTISVATTNNSTTNTTSVSSDETACGKITDKNTCLAYPGKVVSCKWVDNISSGSSGGNGYKQPNDYLSGGNYAIPN